MTVTIKDYIPKYIKQTLIDPERTKVTHTRWNELWNLNIAQGDYHAEVLDLVCKALEDNYLKKSNAEVFTPSGDYEPATKKYVDDAVISAGGYNDEQAQDAVGAILTDTDSIAFNYDDLASLLSAEVKVDEDTLVVDATNHCLKVGPSVWTAGNDGINSGLDADLVRGRNLIGEFDRLSYDNYLRTLELYYTGHFTGPGIAGMRGMTFDGFQDELRVNTDLSSAITIDTTNKLARNKLQWIENEATARISVQNATFTSQGDISLIHNNDLEQSILTYVFTVNAPAGNPIVTIDLDFGEERYVDTISSAGYANYIDGASSYKVIMSTAPESGVYTEEFTQQIYDDQNFSTNSIEVKKAVRYVCLIIDWDGNWAGNYSAWVNEIIVNGGLETGSLYSTVKSLSSAVDSATLYLSLENEATSKDDYIVEISDDGGITYYPFVWDSSRADPLTSGYDEHKYTISGLTGDSIVLKITMQNSFCVIKRYGLHWA